MVLNTVIIVRFSLVTLYKPIIVNVEYYGGCFFLHFVGIFQIYEI